MQVAGFIGRSVVGQILFLESCRALKVLNAVYNTPEVKMYRWQSDYWKEGEEI